MCGVLFASQTTGDFKLGATMILLDDRILVKRIAADKQTPGGILLPDTAKEKPQKGVVIAVGPGKWSSSNRYENTPNGLIDLRQYRLEMQVKVNDTILFTAWAGTEVSKAIGSDDDLIILDEREVLAVLS